MEVIVDLQGFKKAFNKFVLKELAFASVKADENAEFHQKNMVFDEPFECDDLPAKYQRTNTWLTRKYHGLAWDAMGDKPYVDIEDTLTELLEGVTRVFVKGVEKKQWLRELIGKPLLDIVNLEDLGCPKLDHLEKGDTCWQHRRFGEKPNGKYHCALRQVVLLKEWYANYLSGCIEKSLKSFCENGKDLSEMSAEELEYLPKFFLLEFASDHIHEVIDMLPTNLQKDPEIIGYRRCREHWNARPIRDELGGDEPDGPIPFIKNCPLCQLFHQ